MISKNGFCYNETPFGVIMTEYIGHDTKVNIPKEIDGTEVFFIGKYAFATNKTVKEIIIPDGIKQIGHCAFAGCANLEKIFLPESLRRIFNGAFKDCPSLKFIRFNGKKEQWEKVSISDDISHIKVTFNTERSMLSTFLDDRKDADEIRKE